METLAPFHCDHYWTPTPDTLTEPAREFTGTGTPPGYATAVGGPPDGSQTVYVVVRMPLERTALAMRYRERGFAVVAVATREEFLAMLARGAMPATIITDDLKLIERLRKIETHHLPSVPIWAMVVDEGSVMEAYMHGADFALTWDSTARMLF
jgi:hypothetical protein